MKRFRFVAASCVLTLVLSAAVFGGDMPGPGSPEKPNRPPERATVAFCEQMEPRAGEIAAGSTCEEATTDLATDAMIFAIQVALSVF